MATMKLADLISNDEFVKYFRLEMQAKSLLIQSGIATPDAKIAAKVAAGSGIEGKTLDMGYFDSLDSAGDAEVPVESTGASTDKVGTKNDTAVVQFLRKKFGVSDVAQIMGKADPMAHIVSQLTPYWLKQDQKRLLSIVKGYFASNVANNNGDAVLDITSANGAAANLAKDTILKGAGLLGDCQEDLVAVAMNSAANNYLAAIDQNATLYRASEGPSKLATYNGRSVIVDDTVPYDSSTKVATIYLFGKGAVAYNELPTLHPFEMDRNKDTAEDFIHSWRRYLLHIRGVKWVGTVAGLGPTTAELEAAASWSRVFDKKRVPVVCIKAKLG